MRKFKVIKTYTLSDLDIFNGLDSAATIPELIESEQFAKYIDQMEIDGYSFVQFSMFNFPLEGVQPIPSIVFREKGYIVGHTGPEIFTTVDGKEIKVNPPNA